MAGIVIKPYKHWGFRERTNIKDAGSKEELRNTKPYKHWSFTDIHAQKPIFIGL